jgi:hypothetical protein
VLRKIVKLCLAADPDGGGHKVADCLRDAQVCEDAEKTKRLLLGAVELAVERGAAASEMGDASRRAAWLRVRSTGATA